MTPPAVIVAGDHLVLDHIVVLDSLPEVGSVVLHDNVSAALRKTYRGGCSANIAASLARLGVHTALASASGNDAESLDYRLHLTSLGIDLESWTVVQGLHTPHCFCFYDLKGAKLSFMDAIDSADVPRSFAVPDETLDAQPLMVLVGARRDDAWRDAIIDLRSRAKARACRVVQTMCGPASDIAMDAVGQADILICNELEAEWIGRQLGCSAPEALTTAGVSAVFVTRGANGSAIYTACGQNVIAPVTIGRSVEPTGAGDAYVAGVVAALSQGSTYVAAAQWGTVIASFVAETYGSQPELPPMELLWARLRRTFGESASVLTLGAAG